MLLETTPDFTPYIGIPYEDVSSSPEGSDCYGLVRLILENEYGVKCPDYNCADVPVKERGAFIEEHIDDCFIPFPLSSAVVGTILLFRIEGNPVHMGMLTAIDQNGKPLRFIHVMRGINSVHQRFNTVWTNRLLGGFLHKDMFPND